MAFLSFLMVADTASACAVCGGGGQNRQAFIDTMVFMSAMPLLMLAGLAFIVWKLAKAERESTMLDATSQTTGEGPPR